MLFVFLSQQQVSRYLLKLYQDVVRTPNMQLSPPSKYILSLLHESLFMKQKCEARSLRDLYHPEIALAAFQHRAARLILELAQAESAGASWSDLNLECMRLSKVLYLWDWPTDNRDERFVHCSEVSLLSFLVLGPRAIHHD